MENSTENIEIQKVSLTHDIFMKVSYIEKLPNSDERKHPGVSCSAPVHKDLTAAFKLFTPHLAFICEQINEIEFIDSIPEEYDSTVGYSESSDMGEMVVKALASKSKKLKKKTAGLNGTDEKEVLPTDKFTIGDIEFKFTAGQDAVRLSGNMQLSTLEYLNIQAPWVTINGDYKFKDDLFQLVELLKYETKEYIVNHKYAPPVDPELPFGDGEAIADEQY